MPGKTMGQIGENDGRMIYFMMEEWSFFFWETLLYMEVLMGKTPINGGLKVRSMCFYFSYVLFLG